MRNEDSKGRALSEELDAMHAELAASFREQLAKYRRGEVLDQNGNPKPVPANLLAAYSKFLKDNRIDRPADPAGGKDRLAEELEEFLDGDDRNIVPLSRNL